MLKVGDIVIAGGCKCIIDHISGDYYHARYIIPEKGFWMQSSQANNWWFKEQDIIPDTRKEKLKKNMVSIGDKVICKYYEMENLYANRIYTISEIIEDKYIILKGDKYKIIHRMDSFVIDLKETRKSKIDKLNKYI